MSEQIIGLDILNIRNLVDAENGARMFIKAIRNDPRYRDAMIVGMVEAAGDNLSPDYYDRWWKNYPPYMSATHPDRPDGLPGVPTGDKEKDLYDEQLNDRLIRGTIAFEETLITGMSTTPQSQTHEMITMNTLKEQMKTYSITCKKTEKNGIPVLHKERSGKFGGGQDDGIMGVQILNTHSRRIQKDDHRLVRANSTGRFPFLWRVDEKLDELLMRRELDNRVPDSVILDGLVRPDRQPSDRPSKRRKIRQSSDPLPPAPDTSDAGARPPPPSAPAVAAAAAAAPVRAHEYAPVIREPEFDTDMTD